MVKFIPELVQLSESEFTLKLKFDPEFPNLGDHPLWTYWTEPPVDLGYLPQFLSYNDPRRAEEQFDDAYSHGGGWLPVKGFVRTEPNVNLNIQYPGDEVLRPLAATAMRDQWIVFYRHAWVGVFNDDGTFSVARMN